MSKGFDYSKWDNIELSDDEDDVHPNIERESWFRMKHRARVEREETEETDKKKIKTEMSKAAVRIEEIDRFLKKISVSGGGGDDSDSDDELEDVDGLKVELEELRKENDARQKKLDNFEKNKKWNVDNMCRVTEERTIVNPKANETKFSPTGFALPDDDEAAELASKKESRTSAATKPATKPTIAATNKKTASSAPDKKQAVAAPKKTSPAGPKKHPEPPGVTDAILTYSEFVDKHQDTLEEWMTIKSLEKCKDFLLINGSTLLQENATNYLLLASLEDEMNGYHEKMKLTARQSQILTNIAELAKSLKSHPGNVIVPFFLRIDKREFFEGFMEGVKAFIAKIKIRAVEKKKEMDAQSAEENDVKEVDLATIPKEERLGPGGLDPVEVFESLPESLQTAFESREVENLKKALLQMEPSEADYHMKRCVACGLWNEG